MRQLLVECSDPGLVISLDEEFENVLRQLDFERAKVIHRQLTELARSLGHEFENAWGGFRIETPNDCGMPLSFGKRDAEDEERLTELLDRAKESGLGQFELRGTNLLRQGGPAPETRDQYVQDLAGAIRYAHWENGIVHRHPAPLPDAIAVYREQVMNEYAAEALRERAQYPGVGHRWVSDGVRRIEKALEEVNTRAEAVMQYELERLTPSEVKPGETMRWAALAVRLGKEVEKWYVAVEASLAFLYQRVSLAYLLWLECNGIGGARPFLQNRLESYLDQTKTTYTVDARDAVRLVFEELRKPFWPRDVDAIRDSEAEKTDENTSTDC
jgi:hypothetical protein